MVGAYCLDYSVTELIAELGTPVRHLDLGHAVPTEHLLYKQIGNLSCVRVITAGSKVSHLCQAINNDPDSSVTSFCLRQVCNAI